MPQQKSTSEDPTVQMAFRLSVLVRPDSVTVQMQAEEGVRWPTTVIWSKTVRRAPLKTVEAVIETALARATEALPEALGGAVEGGEEW